MSYHFTQSTIPIQIRRHGPRRLEPPVTFVLNISQSYSGDVLEIYSVGFLSPWLCTSVLAAPEQDGMLEIVDLVLRDIFHPSVFEVDQ
jgi:hypothetical protein